MLFVFFKKVIISIKSTIDSDNKEIQEIENRLLNLENEAKKYKLELEELQRDSENKIFSIEKNLDKEIIENRVSMDEYYNKKEKEISLLMTKLKRKSILDIQKNIVEKSISLVSNTINDQDIENIKEKKDGARSS